MSGTVLRDLHTILLRSYVVAVIPLIDADAAAQVRWLAPGHTAALPDCTAQVHPSSLAASLWPSGPLLDDARLGAPQASCHPGAYR